MSSLTLETVTVSDAWPSSLLPIGKANKSGGGLLGQGIATVTTKLSSQTEQMADSSLREPSPSGWSGSFYTEEGRCLLQTDQWLRQTANGHSLGALFGRAHRDNQWLSRTTNRLWLTAESAPAPIT